MKNKPQLIDSIVKSKHETLTQCPDGKWYISKSLPYYGFKGFLNRLYHAYLVLIDKARAHSFAEDVIKEKTTINKLSLKTLSLFPLGLQKYSRRTLLK